MVKKLEPTTKTIRQIPNCKLLRLTNFPAGAWVKVEVIKSLEVDEVELAGKQEDDSL